MADDLQSRLQGDLNAARKAQDKALVLVLGTVLADLKNRRIELRHDLSEADVIDVLQKGIKRRRESIEMFGAAGRTELAERERAEVAVLERYLPPRVDEGELRAAIQAAIAAGAANIGAVMGQVLPKFKGRAEGGVISALAREELAKRG
jgi:uncharacterized protein YqeY